jgi:DHA2 family multidrug resistance protein
MSEPANASGEVRAATWSGFILMCLGMFMAILDIQVVATSLPSIQDALAISREAMSWIQTADLIAEIIAIPLTVGESHMDFRCILHN